MITSLLEFRMFILYILQCCDESLYTGITNDLEHRMETHRSGKGSKYVRAHLPFELIYTEEFPDKSSALKREIEIKKLNKAQKLELIKLDQKGTLGSQL